MNRRAIVVGGGVIGLAMAWELARRNFGVTLIERDTVGKGTSWAAVGVLPPANFTTATDPIDRLRGMSHQLYPQWTKALHELTSIDPGFRRCGGWYLANTAGEHAAMIGMTQYWRELDIQCQSVKVNELNHREPAIATWATKANKTSAWWTPDECQIRSPDLLKSLRSACLKSGVQLVEHFEVLDVAEDHCGVTVTGRSVDSSGPDQNPTDDELDSQLNSQADFKADFKADVAVVCGGSWAGQVAPGLNLDHSIVPVRGQVLMFKSETPTLSAVVNVGNRYLVSRDDGHTLVGSCEEEVGWQFGTTDVAIDRLRRLAWDVCPDLAKATEVGAWSGLRPMTFDGFPMLGRVPGSDNLFVAAGHFRSGIHLAPATAMLMADLMTHSPTAIDLQPFDVGKQQSHSEN